MEAKLNSLCKERMIDLEYKISRLGILGKAYYDLAQIKLKRHQSLISTARTQNSLLHAALATLREKDRVARKNAGDLENLRKTTKHLRVTFDNQKNHVFQRQGKLEWQITGTHLAELQCAAILEPNTPGDIRIHTLEHKLSWLQRKLQDMQILVKQYEATLQPLRDEWTLYDAKLAALQGNVNQKNQQCELLIHTHHDAIRARDAAKIELEEVEAMFPAELRARILKAIKEIKIVMSVSSMREMYHQYILQEKQAAFLESIYNEMKRMIDMMKDDYPILQKKNSKAMGKEDVASMVDGSVMMVRRQSAMTPAGLKGAFPLLQILEGTQNLVNKLHEGHMTMMDHKSVERKVLDLCEQRLTAILKALHRALKRSSREAAKRAEFEAREAAHWKREAEEVERRRQAAEEARKKYEEREAARETHPGQETAALRLGEGEHDAQAPELACPIHKTHAQTLLRPEMLLQQQQQQQESQIKLPDAGSSLDLLPSDHRHDFSLARSKSFDPASQTKSEDEEELKVAARAGTRTSLIFLPQHSAKVQARAHTADGTRSDIAQSVDTSLVSRSGSLLPSGETIGAVPPVDHGRAPPAAAESISVIFSSDDETEAAESPTESSRPPSRIRVTLANIESSAAATTSTGEISGLSLLSASSSNSTSISSALDAYEAVPIAMASLPPDVVTQPTVVDSTAPSQPVKELPDSATTSVGDSASVHIIGLDSAASISESQPAATAKAGPPLADAQEGSPVTSGRSSTGVLSISPPTSPPNVEEGEVSASLSITPDLEGERGLVLQVGTPAAPAAAGTFPGISPDSTAVIVDPHLSEISSSESKRVAELNEQIDMARPADEGSTSRTLPSDMKGVEAVSEGTALETPLSEAASPVAAGASVLVSPISSTPGESSPTTAVRTLQLVDERGPDPQQMAPISIPLTPESQSDRSTSDAPGTAAASEPADIDHGVDVQRSLASEAARLPRSPSGAPIASGATLPPIETISVDEASPQKSLGLRSPNLPRSPSGAPVATAVKFPLEPLSPDPVRGEGEASVTQTHPGPGVPLTASPSAERLSPIVLSSPSSVPSPPQIPLIPAVHDHESDLPAAAVATTPPQAARERDGGGSEAQISSSELVVPATLVEEPKSGAGNEAEAADDRL